MYQALLHTHSTLRYAMLGLLIVVVVKSLVAHFSTGSYSEGDRKLALYTLIASHLQLLVGLYLYFISPMIEGGLADMAATMKNSGLRFYVVEHISMMIIGIAVITIGYSKVKRTQDITKKAGKTALFYGIGLLLILLRMPYDKW